MTAVDRAILRARLDGLTFEQIGKSLRLSKQAVQQRLRALQSATSESAEVVQVLRETNRLLAAVIVQIARTQTSGYPISDQRAHAAGASIRGKSVKPLGRPRPR